MTAEKKAKVIAVCNQKGGCGKTTTTTTLAVGLMTAGYTVAIIDSDPQQSAGDWAAQAATNGVVAPPVLGMTRPTLNADVKMLLWNYDYILIDSISGLSPFSQKIIASILKASDLVVIPVLPSALDVWASGSVIEMIQARQAITDGLPKAVITLNMTRKGTRMSADLKNIIPGFEIPVLDTEFPLSEEIKRQTQDGKTVFALRETHPLRVNAALFISEIIEVLKDGD